LYNYRVIQKNLIMASKRWTAKCWMGQKSGYVDIEVGASTSGGAKEQLINVYGAESVVNLREIREGSSGGGLDFSGGGGTWLVGLLGGGALLLYFTPLVLMTAYGAGATWLTQKIVGISISDFADKDDDMTEDEFKKGISILIAAIVFGGVGFIHGTMWNKDLNKEYNLDGNQTKVEQVRQK
jgi:hypothetical protein